MDKYLSGDQLALIAMKKEHKRLSQIAEKKKAICDEACHVGTNLINVYKQAEKLISEKDYSESGIKKIEKLANEEKRLKKLMKADLVKIMDEQIHAEIDRDSLYREIMTLEFRIKRSGQTVE